VSAAPQVNRISAAYDLPVRWKAPPKPFRRLVRALGIGSFAFGVLVAAAVTVPVLFGYQAFTILSGSMEPAIGTGDVVVVDEIAPLDARVGDVVSFRSPDNPTKILTHRVVEVRAAGNEVRFATKGDANDAAERWSIAEGGTIGRVEYRVPKLGYVTSKIGSTFGRFAFIVIPAVLLALLELKRIWSRDREVPSDAAQR
jgi:signal peptidase I